MYAGLGGSITYNPDGNQNKTAMIGSSTIPSNADKAKFYIQSGGDEPQMAIGRSGGSKIIKLRTWNTNLYLTDKDEHSNINIGDATAIGVSSSAGPSGTAVGANAKGSSGGTAIGCGANGESTYATAIGAETKATGLNRSTALGAYAKASSNSSTAVGANSTASGSSSIALGSNTTSSNFGTIAIGYYANATQSGSVAIGNISSAKGFSAIAIGNAAHADSSNTTALGYGTNASGNNATALGRAAKAGQSNSVAIGYNSYTSGSGVISRAIAIGYNAVANKSDAIAIGGKYGARATTAAGTGSIAIGATSRASGNFSIAIGGTSNTSMNVDSGYASNTYASSTNSIAIGTEANASYVNSTAIGRGARATTSNQIVLGTSSDTVYIPGNLVVGGSTYLGIDTKPTNNFSSAVYIRFRWDNDYATPQIYEPRGNDNNGLYHDNQDHWKSAYYSDRRLKDIKSSFKKGLEDIKQLKVYNYTFKDDENKTPRVGVIAQDLQKVFPDAVTKDEDGFLRIRWEDMFYSLINAVKELDLRITTENTELKNRVTKLEKENKELEKRLSKLEKSFTTK